MTWGWVADQVVDDLELAGGSVVAGQAAEEGFHEVVDEAGEDARGLGRVEVFDLVSPAFAADLFERRLEAAGDELFVEAWGAGWWQLGSWVDCSGVGCDQIASTGSGLAGFIETLDFLWDNWPHGFDLG